MSIILDGTNGIETPTYGGADSAEYVVPVTGFKNRIINGAMMIDQRNAGASLTVNSSSAYYAVDRFRAVGQSADGVFTIQRSTTAPAGFTNSVLITVTTADSSIGSAQEYSFNQNIEGFNVADFNWGSANASTVTLSFWVRSSVTGTFGGGITNNAYDRSYPFSFTISSANTWEQKTVTIAGDTTGTWTTDNTAGLRLYFGIGLGSTLTGTAGAWTAGTKIGVTGATNLISTNGATLYITGVQLEKGTTATSFDYRPYGTELQLCQRYYQVIGGTANGFPMATSYFSATAQTARFPISFPVQMRVSPTIAKNGTWGGNANQPSANYISSAGFAMELNSNGAGMQYSFPDSSDDTFTMTSEL